MRISLIIRGMVSWMSELMLALACLIFALGFWSQQAGPLEKPGFFTIHHGTSVRMIAVQLAQAGIIDSAILFEAAVRLQAIAGSSSSLKAGIYAFDASIPAARVMTQLQMHDIAQFRILLPEGISNAMVEAQINADSRFSGPPVTIAPTAYLRPDSWFVAYGTQRQMFIQRLQQEGEKLLDRLWYKRDPDLPLATAYDALILASIVEREAKKQEELPLIAGLFINRLQRRMRLQSDPTVIYALTGGGFNLNRPLTRRDLHLESPYNSYLNPGLPPTPISNPGLGALYAVLHPAQTDMLYMVADGKGGHFFARTLAQHHANVARYRRIRSENKP
ncbi:MAG: endolytic transglycosylase MltG [Pseudomonadota bacterium]